tara:strand:- start:1599 stop:1865 length:267 start_codon:yes stop_codon:yes gene_type:complete
MLIAISAVGGMVPIWLVGLLVGRFIFKNMETSKKINYSTLVAYIVAVILSGFGNMDGGAYSPQFLTYFLSSVLVIAIRQLIFRIRSKD